MARHPGPVCWQCLQALLTRHLAPVMRPMMSSFVFGNIDLAPGLHAVLGRRQMGHTPQATVAITTITAVEKMAQFRAANPGLRKCRLSTRRFASCCWPLGPCSSSRLARFCSCAASQGRHCTSTPPTVDPSQRSANAKKLQLLYVSVGCVLTLVGSLA